MQSHFFKGYLPAHFFLFILFQLLLLLLSLSLGNCIFGSLRLAADFSVVARICSCSLLLHCCCRNLSLISCRLQRLSLLLLLLPHTTAIDIKIHLQN